MADLATFRDLSLRFRDLHQDDNQMDRLRAVCVVESACDRAAHYRSLAREAACLAREATKRHERERHEKDAAEYATAAAQTTAMWRSPGRRPRPRDMT
jgi:hypothetical protein